MPLKLLPDISVASNGYLAYSLVFVLLVIT